MEYLIDTPQNPMIIYVPNDIDYSEYKEYTKYCCDKINAMKMQFCREMTNITKVYDL